METIVFFARTPEMGRGKTRLRTVLNDEQIYAISRKLYSDLLNTLTHTNHRVMVYYDGKDPKLPCPSVPQIQGELGERMASSIRAELDNGPVVLLGSDLVGVDGALIDEAFRRLKTNDVVLAPAEDGGYGVVGMNRYVDVFSSIVYSRIDVLEKTVQKAEAAGATVSLLPTIRDIDDFNDLVREALRSPVQSVKKDLYGMVYTSNSGDRLWLLKDKDRRPKESIFREPEIMLPFYHCIQRKETK